jgi:acyl-CoA reductase-like NAD-dependent aldehyde dehydrogenase
MNSTPNHNRIDIESAIISSAAAFPSWSNLGPSERRMKLLHVADLLMQHVNDFEKLMLEETNSTVGWAHFNVFLAANMMREAAAITTQINGEIIPSDISGNLAMATRQPLGVILGIAPWNAPVILGVRSVAVPLACGNTVILKGSEVCPKTYELISKIFRKADFGDGVIQIINTSPEDTPNLMEMVISHPLIKKINFTGSTKNGKKIAEAAAKYLKPVVLELGGNAPLIILDDADIEEAVNASVFGSFVNQGQVCMSTERIIVDKKIADVFVNKLKERTLSVKFGKSESDADIGEVIDSASANRINDLITDALDKGAIKVTGEENRDTLISPIIINHVTPEMKIFHEEIFGPVVAISHFTNIEEAIVLANQSDYGLSAAVFGKDIARALVVAKRIESGICHINSSTVHDEAQMPFGGVKQSGYGRFGGKAAINEFTQLRWITIQTEKRQYPF